MTTTDDKQDEWDEKAKFLRFDSLSNTNIAQALREASHAQDAEVEKLQGELARMRGVLLEIQKDKDEDCCAHISDNLIAQALVDDHGWLARKLDEREILAVNGAILALRLARMVRAADFLEAAQARARKLT